MNTETWIKTSDRAPTEQDLPVLLWNKCVPKAKYCATKDALRCQLGLTCFSHWMKAPEPPREETQYDKDDSEFTKRHGESWQGATREQREHHAGRRIGWMTALAYERAEVAKMLPKPSQFMPGQGTLWAIIEAIRARCGGGGK